MTTEEGVTFEGLLVLPAVHLEGDETADPQPTVRVRWDDDAGGHVVWMPQGNLP
ncbi:MAG TPA: hypothetical protein VFR35_07400 [Actinoplanes sp.]|nr:hypothetical protein [Actinoplanes sp.]